jgi:hypothetical protein
MVSDFSPLYGKVRNHKEKDRQYNGEKREIINRRTDNAMKKSQKP